MRDKEEELAKYNNHPIQQPNKFRYSQLDLCFAYSKSKPKQNKIFSPITTHTQLTKENRSFDHPKFRMSCRLDHKHQSFQDTTSTTFFKTNKVKSARHQNTEQQSDEIPHIGWAFPQRKKKTGEQQFLKLLMKYSDNLMASSNFREKESIQGLFETNPQKKRNLKPKLKTRLNWVKDRYCVNRDKQGGLFEYNAIWTTSKQVNIPSLPNFNVSLTKKHRK